MRRYTASDMNTLMTLQAPVRLDMPSGGVQTSYVTIEDLWVCFEALVNNPSWYANALMPIAQGRITMHYRTDLAAGYQLLDTTNTDIPHIYRVWQGSIDLGNRHILSQVLVQELEAGKGVVNVR